MADTFYFKGKATWANVQKPAKGYDDTKMAYSIDLTLDEPSSQLFDQAALQLWARARKKEERARKKGEAVEMLSEDYHTYTFKRPTERIRKGELEKVTPLKVTNANGEVLKDLVGNGSTVVCKVEVYKGARGTGHILEEVRVLDLVPFNESKTMTTDDIVPF